MDLVAGTGDDGWMRLILIRHGQTPSNVRGLLDTAAPGASLTELGHEQAQAVPEVLGGERIDAIFASDLVRTHETARPLLADRDLPLVVRPGIREIQAGRLEMLGDHDSVMTYVGMIANWHDDIDARVPGGESGSEVFHRFDSVVAEAYASGAGSAVFFSHGAVMRTWTSGRARNLPLQFAAETPVRNTGVLVLEGTPYDGWEILTWEGDPIGGESVDSLTGSGPTGEAPIGQ